MRQKFDDWRGSRGWKEVLKIIVKKRSVPNQLLRLEAFIRRSSHTPDKVVADYTKRKLGYQGECSIDFYLSMLPPNQVSIMHDLRLHSERNGYFQLDTLLLTPQGLIILEIKNYQGTLYFDEYSHQVTRVLNEKEERIANPLLQVSRQRSHLHSHLISHGLPSLPIHTFVVFSSPLTILRSRSSQQTLSPKIIHAEAIPTQVESYVQKGKQKYLTLKQIQEIATLLNNNHQPDLSNNLTSFNLNKVIKKGVHCPQCNQIAMHREPRIQNWKCAHCNNISKVAHIFTLQDYALLFQPTITNLQAQDFLQISNENMIKYLMRKLKLKTTGQNKGRKYHIPIPFEAKNYD
ncbi:nuclease-related domain-containing protein [Alkalicoccobacillus porphyridii]|uniref:NERD domain-containing protein n=1 Tax=Alkalicoccobacillus porphyridii TaxID=2597270 RepID=A0A553ZWF7_9BACI|nr:nuclease-related domain-containing protein [Alkalicoccobacillus porphyridii]TSB45799.1 NERD domain-containing protein [Alkalicoccobacillus porphyridii]